MAPFPNVGTAPFFLVGVKRGMRYVVVLAVALALLISLGFGLSGAVSGPGVSGSGTREANAAGVVARTLSFLTDDPRACVSCHVMETQHEGWFHAPHREVATCNDCHLPNGNPAAKWLVKVQAGVKDTVKFWTGAHPVNIKAAESSKAIVQANCLRCHGELVREVRKGGGQPCFACHRSTSHPL